MASGAVVISCPLVYLFPSGMCARVEGFSAVRKLYSNAGRSSSVHQEAATGRGRQTTRKVREGPHRWVTGCVRAVSSEVERLLGILMPSTAGRERAELLSKPKTSDMQEVMVSITIWSTLLPRPRTLLCLCLVLRDGQPLPVIPHTHTLSFHPGGRPVTTAGGPEATLGPSLWGRPRAGGLSVCRRGPTWSGAHDDTRCEVARPVPRPSLLGASCQARRT